MQFNRVYRRASVVIAMALAAASIFASAASAMVLEGPIHQTETTGATVPASQAPARIARTYWFTVPTAPYSNRGVNARVKPVVPAVPAAKIAASSNGFDWGDAAIGAGIAVSIVFLVTGGALVARRRTQLGEA